MRIGLLLLLVSHLALACGGGANRPVPSTVTAVAPEVDPTSERLGGLGLGDTAAAVEAALGPPASKTEPVEYGATGETISDWAWPDRGVTLSMMLDAGAAGGARIESMTIKAPATLTTSRGVGIGTSRAEVERIYGAYVGIGRQPDEPDTTSPEQLIIGSLYGGTFFMFSDGKVSEIFVGAAAE